MRERNRRKVQLVLVLALMWMVWQRRRSATEAESGGATRSSRRVQAHVDIKASPERVFAVIADPRKSFLTSNPVAYMELGSEQSSGVGTIYRWTFRLPFGRTFCFDETVTEWEENQKFAYSAIRGWEMHATTELQPVPHGTRVVFTLTYRLPWPWNVLLPDWLEKLGAQRAISNIKRLAEGKTAERRPIGQAGRRIDTQSALFAFAFKPVTKWAVHRALLARSRAKHRPEQGCFTLAEVDGIVRHTWGAFKHLAPTLPHEPTVGSRMNLRLACLSIAFVRALVARGVERGYAIELFAAAAWEVYERWAMLPRFVAGLAGDPRQQMRICVNLFLRFPFNPPAYRFDTQVTSDGIAVTMRRCPIAEYFQARGAADVCVGGWCNLDYPLAEMWGGRLERSGTLAAGADRCDFHFKVKE